jgi:nitrite reductase/ring-hydroxylating ferredoxin subunit
MPARPQCVMTDVSRLLELRAVNFELTVDGVSRPAFVVRYRGQPRGYINACRHQFRSLDFGDGHFFDDAADALVCCHHGARYDPENGHCVAGPCAGTWLTALVLEQRGRELWCLGVAPARHIRSDPA